MKKFFLTTILFLFLMLSLIIGYLSTFGYETNKFNSLLENRINSYEPNIRVKLSTIKIKIDLKNISFFVTTSDPKIDYQNINLNVNQVDAYINLKSLLTRDPKINKISIISNKTKINDIKKVVKYFKPSNFKKFFLNEVKNGEINFNLDLTLSNNEVKDYEINGFVKKLSANFQEIELKNTSFIYLVKKDFGELNSLRGFVNGFQINSGSIKIDNEKSLKINGEIKSDADLDNNNLNNLLPNKLINDFKKIKLNGILNSNFKVIFDKTLKITDFDLQSSGTIKKSELVFKYPKEYLFFRDKISLLNFEKTEFDISLSKDKKKKVSFKGLLKINDGKLQKIDLKNIFSSNNQLISINSNFDNEINIPILNFNTNGKVTNLKSEIELNKNSINIKKLLLSDNKKSAINVNGVSLRDGKLKKFESISVKTYKDEILNNDFTIKYGKEIKVDGKKYDSSNLTKLLNVDDNSKFLKNINKEISINIKEVYTNVSDIISDFTLIGKIQRGKFTKIISKGKFHDDKFLEISLKKEISTDKKFLEIYSDLPKPLLSNYKFFKGLSGGQLLLSSSYNSKKSNSNLTIENFKVKDAPGLVKLLSLADFGGMVDALSGEGLSFEKLEMTFDKDQKVLNLTELYAIGPSISILMEGYVESSSGLISLRGTMVPAKTLNKFLSRLPVVGDILIPKEIGEGLFGISFKMKGLPGKVKISVDPIKTLTPRFIQKALKKTK